MSSLVPFDTSRTMLTGAALGYPIAWPNVTFKKPNPVAPWLAVECTSHTLDPVELSGGVWQEEGTLYVDVFVPAGTGTDTARTIAKNVSNIFRGQYGGPVIYNGGSIGNGSIAESDGMWWVITVTMQWRYQDTSNAIIATPATYGGSKYG